MLSNTTTLVFAMRSYKSVSVPYGPGPVGGHNSSNSESDGGTSRSIQIEEEKHRC